MVTRGAGDESFACSVAVSVDALASVDDDVVIGFTVVISDSADLPFRFEEEDVSSFAEVDSDDSVAAGMSARSELL